MSNYNIKTSKTYSVYIHIAGKIEVAEQFCRKFFYKVGGCVKITKANYIYTGGEESGMTVEFINYPRFPDDEIPRKFIKDFAIKLAKELCQKSFTIQYPDETVYIELIDK